MALLPLGLGLDLRSLFQIHRILAFYILFRKVHPRLLTVFTSILPALCSIVPIVYPLSNFTEVIVALGANASVPR